jgi:hypothetical protein
VTGAQGAIHTILRVQFAEYHCAAHLIAAGAARSDQKIDYQKPTFRIIRSQPGLGHKLLRAA